MWLRLTLPDETNVAVNFDNVVTFHPVEGGTWIATVAPRGDSVYGLQVKEDSNLIGRRLQAGAVAI